MAKSVDTTAVEIRCIGAEEPIRFAAKELSRYLGLMTGNAPKVVRAKEYDPEQPGIWVGTTGSFAAKVPAELRVAKDAFDDGVFVEASKGAAIVAGVNARSVVFAAYRFLEELGCRWFRPGPLGEHVPQVKTLPSRAFTVAERPSARHRCICIEGSCAFEHVRDTIDYAAKRGFNAYYFQFQDSYVFFNIWHSQERHGDKPGKPLTPAEAQALSDRCKTEALKRGLALHTVGHGWTTSPFGIAPNGWTAEDKLTPAQRSLFAMIDGKRGMNPRARCVHHQPLVSNLCYSNPKARSLMVADIVRYAEAHPEEEVLHVWLADGSNNNCECPECQKDLPSDLYVLLLNEIDESLTNKGLSTRIVFLAYVDLLWGPRKNRIANPDRFILMFAPITRSYDSAFLEKAGGEPEKVPAFVRNKLTFPKSPQANLTLLDSWRRNFKGECVDFDYHLWGKSQLDPGQMQIAHVLFKDLRDLPKLGMDGFISCQYQRVAFPSGFALHVMGKTLWDRKISYNKMADDYFTDLFGPKGLEVRKYLEALSRAFTPAVAAWDLPGPEELEKAKARWAKAAVAIVAFRPTIARGLKSKEKFREKAWSVLDDHAWYASELCRFYAFLVDKNEEAVGVYTRIENELNRRRKRLTPVLDIHCATRFLRRQIMARR